MFIRIFYFFLLFFPLVSCLSTQAVYEEPQYTVLHNFENIEIRNYKQSLIAEIIVSGSRREASYKAFRELANFITGEKQTRPKPEAVPIKMTQPVVQQKYRKDSLWKISFFMPSEWTKKTLPKPSNKNIKIKNLGQRQIAVIRFSGFWSDDNFDEQQEELKEYLERNRYKIKSEPIIAYYNSPFVPWFMRRNEVMFIVSK